MSYLYKANLDPLNKYQQVEIRLDSGDTAILQMGHYYDLTTGELARASQYVVLLPGTNPGETPDKVYYLPVKGDPKGGDIPVWDSIEAAFALRSDLQFDAEKEGGLDVDASAAQNFDRLQQLIYDAAAEGVSVTFNRRGATYAIDDVLLNPAGVPMIGNNVTLNGSAIPAAGALATQYLMKVQGGLSGSSVAATGAITAGSLTAPFPTAAFQLGDVVLLSSNTELYMAGVSGATETKKEIRRVLSATGGVVTFTEGTRFSYLSGSTTTLQKISMVDKPIINGVSFKMGGAGSAHNGVLFEYCMMPMVARSRCDGCEDTGYRFSYCWDFKVNRSEAYNSTSPSTGPNPVGTTGYGFSAVNASRDGKIQHSKIVNCRHGVAGGSCAVAIDVDHNELEGCGIGSGTSLDCHEACFDWAFDYNRIQGALSGGIGIRGQGCKARYNWGRNLAGYGIYVKGFDDNPNGLNDTEVIGNDFQGTGGAGLRVEGTATCRVVGLQARDNIFHNNGLNNITILLADDVALDDNDLAAPVGSGSDGNNIRIVGSSVSDRCTDVRINGGAHKDAPLRWLKADFTNGLTLNGPYIADNPNNQLLTSCLGVKVCSLNGPAAPLDFESKASNSNWTRTILVDAAVTRLTTNITADRIVSLIADQNLYAGARFKIIRAGTGAFNLNVANGLGGATIKAMPATSSAEFVYDGANWVIIDFGTL